MLIAFSSCLVVGQIFYIVALIPATISLPTAIQSAHLHHVQVEPYALSTKVRERRSAESMDDEEISVANLTPQEILQLLIMRFNNKIHHEPRARMILDEFTDKDISEICGTSSSLKCGRDVLMAFDEESGDVEERCNIRKTFLECIDDTRKECKAMAKKGVFPILPPKGEVANIQGKVWRALWTSGGCLLSN